MIEKYNKTHIYEVKTMREFEDKVIDSEYPTIVMVYEE